jgi:L-lysine exporter family protein LysE/ArgO
MRDLILLLNGVFLGLGAAAPIGPVNVEIARRTIRFGRLAGFLLGCGAVTVDVGYAVVTSFALRPAVQFPLITKYLSLIGGLFLGYLAFLCLRSASRGHESKDGEDTPVDAAAQGLRLSRHYLTGLLLTALNPLTLAFWFVGVPGAVANLLVRPRVDLPIVCAGVFLGAFSWVCFFTALIGRLNRFGGGGRRWMRWVDLAGGLTLLTFALRSIWRFAASTL